MFKSNKNKLESLEEHVDDLRGYIDVCNRAVRAFKSEVRQAIDDLAAKLDEAANAGNRTVEKLQFDISNLQNRFEQLNEWDDLTRNRFSQLMKHLGLSFTEGLRVVEREDEDED